MCGRYTITEFSEEDADFLELPDGTEIHPSYNIAPGQNVPVAAAGEDSHRELRMMHWGLIPEWIKDSKKKMEPINARAETAAEKPFFRNALRQRRCIIPADGFYEWEKSGEAKKPYFIQMKTGRIFGFAGLWEEWLSPLGKKVQSCAILTTSANRLMSPIHDRMPVILHPEDFGLWMDPHIQNPTDIEHLFKPHPSKDMKAHPVSRYVNSPAHNSPRCVEPAGESVQLDLI